MRTTPMPHSPVRSFSRSLEREETLAPNRPQGLASLSAPPPVAPDA